LKAHKHRSCRRTNNPTSEVAETVDNLQGKARSRAVRDPGSEPVLQWNRRENGKTTFAPHLKIDEKIDPETWLEALQGRKGPTLFDIDGFENPRKARYEFYQHSGNWSNRLVHAESKRAMSSLLAYDRLEGQVQCIYFDPPYGMDFDASWQGTDGKVVTAFRDRYERGVHSYLDELREALELCRELLAESGSLFLQIGDVNVHRAAVLLDEVFGAENRVRTISYKTTGGGSSTREIPKSCDYLLWYARDRDEMKFRQLYEEQDIRDWIETQSFSGGGGTARRNGKGSDCGGKKEPRREPAAWKQALDDGRADQPRSVGRRAGPAVSMERNAFRNHWLACKPLAS